MKKMDLMILNYLIYNPGQTAYNIAAFYYNRPLDLITGQEHNKIGGSTSRLFRAGYITLVFDVETNLNSYRVTDASIAFFEPMTSRCYHCRCLCMDETKTGQHKFGLHHLQVGHPGSCAWYQELAIIMKMREGRFNVES